MAKTRAEVTPERRQVVSVLPPRPQPVSDARVAPGDIRFAVLDGSRRLVLVLSAADGHVCQVALVTNEFDLATDQDIRFVMAEAGLPYDIVVETDVNGPVRPDQLGDRVGQLTGALLEWVSEAALEGRFHPELDGRRGLPIRDLNGSRGAWKVREGELLDRNLVSAAEADVPLFVDAAIFGPGTSASPECLEEAMLGVTEGRARLGPRACVALFAYARDPDAVPWLRDAARALTRTVLRGRATPTDSERWEGPRRRRSGLPIEALIADVAEAEVWHADILTVKSAWVRALPTRALGLRSPSRNATIHLIDCSEPARA
jgi:hypothetical protein